MKILKSVWILSLVVFCAPPLLAQWTIDLNETTQHLDSVCAGSGHPLADGTEIRIYHDWNSNGPDAADTLLRVCDDPPTCDAGPNGSVNYNIFWINTGAQSPFFAGGFMTINLPLELSVFCAYAEPSPNRIYLRVCFGSRHYDSEILSPTGGGTYSEIEIGTWTCVEAPCPGCSTPPTPAGFTASDSTSCTSVNMHWHFTEALDADVDSVFIHRGVDFIGRVRASQTDTTFVDATVPDAAQYTYYAKSRRNCGGGNYAFSSTVADFGAKYPSPPAITFTGGLLGATDDSCRAVRVSWSYGSNAGVDSFIIQRNGVPVGAVVRRTTPGTMTFNHVTTDSTRGGYRVYGWNPVCGAATCSVVDSGRAKQPPAYAPTGINATDGLCNVTTVTWDSVGGTVTAYKIYRFNITGGDSAYLGTVNAPTRTFNDGASSSGTVFRYKVKASNTCGDGPMPSTFDTGYRVVTPATVTGVQASDSTSCDTVTVTWTNITQETGYKVYRTPAAGGTTDTLSSTVPADCTRFWDLTATPGVLYNYGVRAFNACGNGPASATNSGKRKSPAGKPGNVLASDGTNCGGVVITWGNVAREDSFTIFRNDVRIGRTGPDTLTFTDLTADTLPTHYGYTIRACNACGCSTSVVDSGYRPTRPGQVTGLFASDTACANVFLRWNDLAREDSFKILRNGVYIARNVPNDTDYVDASAVAGTTYAYRILAWNACGNGDTSVVDSGRRVPPPPAVSSITATDTRCDSVLLTWTDVSGEDSFQIRRNGARLDVVLANVLSYGDASAVPGTRYKYEVATYNACGFVTPTASDSGGPRDIPGQIQDFSASRNSCDSIYLAWSAAANVDSYAVYRNDTLKAKLAPATLHWTDLTATPGVEQRYNLRPWNSCGFGPWTGEIGGLRLVFPSVPTSLACTQTLCDRIRVVWNAASGDVDSYRLIRDGTDSVTISKDSTGYDDLATPGVHTYVLKAVSNECGATEASAQASGERLAPPPAVATISASDTVCGGVLVEWTDVAGEDSFVVRRDGARLAMVPAGTLHYDDTSAVAGIRYKYEVAPYNACGFTAPTVSDSGSAYGLPDRVTGLTASESNCAGVDLQWSPATNVDSFGIYRNSTRIGTTISPQTSFFDATAGVDVTYAYGVTAFNVCGEGQVSDPAFGLRRRSFVNLITPNGGEKWQINGTNTVRWLACGADDGLRLELNRNYPMGVWEVLAAVTEDDGEEAVFVAGDISSHCRVRIVVLPDLAADTSDADFRIGTSQGYLALVRAANPSTPVTSWNIGHMECPASIWDTFRLKNFGSETIVVFQPQELISSVFSRTTSCPPFFSLSPGQMSSCNVVLGFTPSTDGSFTDTLVIQTNAENGIGGYVRIPLSGSQITTPSTPQVVITIAGDNACLSWQRVTGSIGGCPISVSAYLVSYSPTLSGPYYFHGFTTDTSYTHYGVVRFAEGLFYNVRTYIGPLHEVISLPTDGTLTETDVLIRLRCEE